MREFIKHQLPFNLQFFAEGDEGTNDEGSTGEGNSNTDELNKDKDKNFDLDGILAKRLPGLVKSIMKDNGFNEEEVKAVLAKYKEPSGNKETTTKVEEPKTNPAVDELKNSLFESRINASAFEKANEIGVDIKTMKYILKLADKTDVVDTNGVVNETKLVESINKVLADIPQLKTTTTQVASPQSKGFVNIGADNTGDNKEDPLIALKKAMGLK